MGYELRRQLREQLGPNVTGLQRAVALEIADDARHDADGRRSKASLKDLARWTGAKDTAVVRNALKRLAEAGWEFRLPISKGKDGRILYAVPGRSMEFRVPAFPEGATAPSEGATAHSDAESQSEPGLTQKEPPLTLNEPGLTLEGAGATPPPQTTHHTSPLASDDAGNDATVITTEPQQQALPASPVAEEVCSGANSPRRNRKRKPATTKANQHQVADELTAAFWDLHGKGRAQPFIAVRGVIRTAISNGVARNDLAHALDRVAREGRSISGATLDIALGAKKRPFGNTAPPPAPRDLTDEEIENASHFG